jgi:hypothetical protein
MAGGRVWLGVDIGWGMVIDWRFARARSAEAAERLMPMYGPVVALSAACCFDAGTRIRRRALIIQLETWLRVSEVTLQSIFFSSSVG